MNDLEKQKIIEALKELYNNVDNDSSRWEIKRDIEWLIENIKGI